MSIPATAAFHDHECRCHRVARFGFQQLCDTAAQLIREPACRDQLHEVLGNAFVLRDVAIADGIAHLRCEQRRVGLILPLSFVLCVYMAPYAKQDT